MNHLAKTALPRTLLCFALAALIVAPAGAAAPEIASMSAGSSAIVWQPTVAYQSMTLTVSGPWGAWSREFDSATVPSLDLYDADGFPLADGFYRWELRAAPVVSNQTRATLDEARATGDYSKVWDLRISGVLPTEPMVTSGSFRVENGAFVSGALQEDLGAATPANGPSNTSGAVQSTSAAASVLATNDGVIRSSLCVGIDCPTSPNFGSDTIRIQENNTRIHFDDTSSSGSFPNNDWRLVANETSNGGRNVFYIEDSTAGTEVISVEAGAGNNALYIDSDGQVGLGTRTPAVEIQSTDGDTPTLRLDQDGSSGFTPQTWDVAGNETNFFVRDVNHSSHLPFRILTGAADDALVIDGSGDLGIGTDNPSASVHLRRTDGSAQVLVQDTGAAENMVLLESAGVSTRFVVENTNDTSCSGGTDCSWSIGMRQNSSFFITRDGSGNDECTLDTTGNFTCIGTVSGASSRTLKDNIELVDSRAMLDRVLALPVTEWTYIRELTDGVRHVGPIAEDFYALFSLGKSDKFLAATDAAGVALAAIQGLNQVVEEKDAQLERLEAENDDLATRLAALEAVVAAIGTR